MSTRGYDAIIVGAGHNGLVTAAYLARSGLRVLLLEAAAEVGGATRIDEFHPGFRTPGLAHLLPGIDPRVVGDLGLDRHGRESLQPVTSMVMAAQGEALVLPPDADSAARNIARKSTADAEAYPGFRARMRGHVQALAPLFQATPPRLDFSARGNLAALARMGWSLRRRGRRSMRDLLRIATMNVADLVEEEFETDELRGAIALDAVLGNNHGPRSPNTVFTYLYRLACFGDAPLQPRARATRLAEDLVAIAQGAGAEVRTSARVGRIDVSAGIVRGVELVDGTRLEADIVVSNADPVSTFSELVDADHLDADFRRDVRAIRNQGMTGRVSIALDRLPDLPEVRAGAAQRWLFAPSVDHVERAFDAAKHGDPVSEPALEVTLPTLSDPTLAPEGRHVMSVNVVYAARGMDAGESALAESVLARLEHHLPGFRASVLACEALGPCEIEARYGNRGGHWHHADIALDQYFTMRPVAGFAQYRAPVDGLYLCGAGTHPGGNVTGVAGANAAREILLDRKQGRRVA